MDWRALQAQAAPLGLTLLGGFHPLPTDQDLQGIKTLVLIGPDPDSFWSRLTAAPQIRAQDPVDSYSRITLTAWAEDLGASALFPFGTPLRPFVSWALRSGQCHISPVGFLVHNTNGLMVSFRGALGLAERIDVPAAGPAPCLSCADQPCQSACPVNVLAQGYDTAACHRHLETPQNVCLARGCAVRRACPLSPPRPDAQSAHHMRYFHR